MRNSLNINLFLPAGIAAAVCVLAALEAAPGFAEQRTSIIMEDTMKSELSAIHLRNDSYVIGTILHETPDAYMVTIVHGDAILTDYLSKDTIISIRPFNSLASRPRIQRLRYQELYAPPEDSPQTLIAEDAEESETPESRYLTTVNEIAKDTWNLQDKGIGVLRKWVSGAIEYDVAHKELLAVKQGFIANKKIIEKLVTPKTFARPHKDLEEAYELYEKYGKLIESGFASRNLLIINQAVRKLEEAESLFYDYLNALEAEEKH